MLTSNFSLPLFTASLENKIPKASKRKAVVVNPISYKLNLLVIFSLN